MLLVSSSLFPKSGPTKFQNAEIVCTDSLSSPLASIKRSDEADLVGRQIPCPTGLHCGPGPEINCNDPENCDLAVCADDSVCQYDILKRSAADTLANRQFGCPPGVECGPGPVCTPELCDLPGCADAVVCQKKKKRTVTAALVERQGFGCPPGVPCGHGPECAGDFCALPGCDDAEACQGYQGKKRNAGSEIVHPVCDICVMGDNGVPICGCAVAGGGKMRRAAENFCPEFCIVTKSGDEVCGCAAEEYEESSQGGERKA